MALRPCSQRSRTLRHRRDHQPLPADVAYGEYHGDSRRSDSAGGCTDQRISLPGRQYRRQAVGASRGQTKQSVFRSHSHNSRDEVCHSWKIPQVRRVRKRPWPVSSARGADFRAVLQAFVSLCDDSVLVPEPPKGKWLHAGEIVGDHYSLAWRV